MSKKVKITEEYIKSKLDEFDNAINNAINNSNTSRKSETQMFLESISEQIKKALTNGVSYPKLKKIIKDVYNIDISTQTLMAYAHNKLGIAKRSRKKNTTDNNSATTVASNNKDVSSTTSSSNSNSSDDGIVRKKTNVMDI